MVRNTTATNTNQWMHEHETKFTLPMWELQWVHHALKGISKRTCKNKSKNQNQHHHQCLRHMNLHHHQRHHQNMRTIVMPSLIFRARSPSGWLQNAKGEQGSLISHVTCYKPPAMVLVQCAVQGWIEVGRNPVQCNNCVRKWISNNHVDPTICSCPFFLPLSAELLFKCQRVLCASKGVYFSHAHECSFCRTFAPKIQAVSGCCAGRAITTTMIRTIPPAAPTSPPGNIAQVP